MDRLEQLILKLLSEVSSVMDQILLNRLKHMQIQIHMHICNYSNYMYRCIDMYIITFLCVCMYVCM